MTISLCVIFVIALFVCVPGICDVNELEKFLKVLWSSDDDGLGGGDGPYWLIFRLHHAFYKSQPIKLRMKREE